MARVMTRSKIVDRNGMRMQPAELLVVIAVIIGVGYAARWYFIERPKKPQYALTQFLSAVKNGKVTPQYELLDSADKQVAPTKKDYDTIMPMARGYTARIENFELGEAKPDAKNPNVVRIPVKLSIRKTGQELYQSGSDAVEDEFALRRDKSGKWKVWLQQWKGVLVKKVPPSPPGDTIGMD